MWEFDETRRTTYLLDADPQYIAEVGEMLLNYASKGERRVY
jgi:hypothetical protein